MATSLTIKTLQRSSSALSLFEQGIHWGKWDERHDWTLFDGLDDVRFRRWRLRYTHQT
jgi:hypothetical protein